ncbi:stage II sporulation protein P [Robertmurraya korlensis]|uniref:stage II sporulation protein P n=1 Tax=Robertmurraya korlensis TaxID=519977 RepID=UPI000824EA99|nr:stage II sporulation protein P [Robertmurraya korlensis]
MQNDKELFDQIKQSFPYQPTNEFVSSTENRLRKLARKMDRNRKVKRVSLISTGALVFSMFMSWVFLFDGKQEVISSLTNHNTPPVLSETEEQEPLVYIYHTHNMESYLPEINKKGIDQAWDEVKNITQVGEKLGSSLKERGIHVIHDQTKVHEIIEDRGLRFEDSYKVSRERLNQELQRHSSIQMVFDIHRDSLRRNQTTVTINGKEYAQVTFVLSNSPENYEKNHKLAEAIHQGLLESYPQLSKGVVTKSKSDKTITYNQELKAGSMIVEIGGVDNTFEESFRTVEALADVIEKILKKQSH